MAEEETFGGIGWQNHEVVIEFLVFALICLD